MKRIALKVDSKGRIQIPRQVREELGIKERVSATIEEDGTVKIEPVQTILERLGKNVTFKFQSVGTDMPRLRVVAEGQLQKEASM